MSDFVKRSLQIFAGGVGSAVKDYTSNLESLKNDASTILSSIKDSGKDASETFSRIKSSGFSKRISDWFYQKESDYEDYDLSGSDEDFDPGFDIDDDGETTTARILDVDSMKDVARGQVGAMYKIAGKQSEVSVANTAEIVSSFNNRSAEIIASVNNINKTLINLSEKLDNISKGFNSVSPVSYKTKQDDIYNYSGALSLSGIFNEIKNRSSNSLVSSVGSMVAMGIQNMRPEDLVGTILSGVAGKIKPSFLGGKSINDIGESFNNTVEVVTHNVLSELIDSKPFKRIFGDLNKTEADKDYGKLVRNNYNTDQAIFDGMTRHSIIHVIPEYLKKINESLSGQRYEVDHKGRLTTNPENKFNTVTQNAFSNGLSWETTSSLYDEVRSVNVNMSKSDITEASKVLTMVYVMYLYKNGRRSLKSSQISTDDLSVVSQAAQTLASASGKSYSHWYAVCESIMLRLVTNPRDAYDFSTNVTRQLKTMDKKATEMAVDERYSSQATKLSYKIAESEYIKHYQKDIINQEDNFGVNEPEEKNIFKIIKKNLKEGIPLFDSENNKKKSDKSTTTVDATATVQKLSHNYTMLDYSRGIFGILNRGINVRVTNSSDDLKGYDNYEITRSSVDSHFNNAFKHFSSSGPEVSDGDSNFLSNMMDKMLPKGIRISMQRFADAFGIGNNKNQKGDETEEGKTIVPKNSISDKIKQLINPTLDKFKQVGNNVFGEKVDNGDGTSSRQNGIAQSIGSRVSNKASNVKSNISNKINDKLDDMIIKRNYNQTVKDVNNMVPKNEDEEYDKLKAQNIFALMQTSVADGDTTADIGAISQQINSIKDSKLKAQLQNSVIPMLQRSGDKSGKKKSGIFGTIATGILLGAKKIFSPIVKAFKVIFTGIKNVGGKIADLLGSIVKSGMTDISVGASNMARGLFGQKAKYDDQGNEIRPSSEGYIRSLIKLPGRVAKSAVNKVSNSETFQNIGEASKNYGSLAVEKITDSKAFKTITNIATTVGSFAKKTIKSIGKATLNGVGKIIGFIQIGFNKISEKVSGLFGQNDNNKPKDGENNKGIKNKISGGLSSFMNSDFMKGFTGVFKERAEKREKQRLANLKIETVADAKAAEIEDMVKGNKDSVFSKIASLIEEVRDKLCSDLPDETKGYNKESDKNIQVNEENQEGEISEEGNAPKKKGILSRVKDKITGKGATDAAVAVAGGSAGSSILGSLGQIIGGGLSSLMGVGKIILAALAPLTSLQTLINLVKNVWEEGIQPLNKIFDTVIKTLKPVLSIATKLISTIAESVVSLVSPLLTVLEIIEPAFQSIMEFINPMLDMVTTLVNTIMAPLSGVLTHVLVPIVKNIGYTLDIISGVVQTGMGLLLTAMGGLMMGVGAIAKIFGEDSIYDKGSDMASKGTDMVKSGISSIASGTKNLVVNNLNMIPGVEIGEDKNNDEKSLIPVNTNPTEIHGSIMDGLVGSGDTITNNDNHSIINNIYNTYGSGDNGLGMQSSYGSYMNMGSRGCGPIALADAYSRRTGRNVDPRSLASHMSKTGTYNPNAGTSVGGFIDAGRSMGMNMRVGGVTQDSLKRATPSNPITVIGSGGDYGTRRGNNHYVNVIGTDRHGGAYVSNPLTGRVDRRSISTVAHNSLLGLYGSGDDDNGIFKFDDSVTEAMKELKETASGILDIFNFDSSANEAQEIMDKEKTKASIDKTKQVLGEEKYAEYEDKAREAFQKANPKRDGETDEAYEKRFQKQKDKYMLSVTNEDVKKQINDSSNTTLNSAVKSGEAWFGSYDPETGEFAGGGYLESLKDTLSKIQANSQFANNSSNSSGSGYFTADNGVALWTPYSDNIEITETDVTKNNYNSPLFEFFAKTMGMSLGSIRGSSWFRLRNNPNKEGEGSTGDKHGGIDFAAVDGNIEGKPLYATTGGVVERVNTDTSQAEGNSIMWKDNGGMYHWYMHMKKPAEIQAGSVKPGDLLGYVGNTGESYGAHLHYTIRDTSSGYSSDNHSINPLMYFKNYNPYAGSLVGDNDEEKIWAYLTSHGANKNAAAGFMGVWEHESDNNPNRLEGDYAMGGVGSPAVIKAFSSQENMNDYVQTMVHQVYGGWQSLNKQTYNPDGVNFYPGVGLAQWTGTRTQGVANKAKAMGTKWNDLETQLSFWEDEVNSSYASALKAANEAGSPGAAAEKVLNMYEGLSSSNQYAFLADRQKHANHFYDIFKDWTPKISGSVNTTPTGQGSSTTGFGMVNSPGDERILNNTKQIGTGSGKNTGTVVANGGLNMRNDPSLNGEIITLVPNGTKLDLETSGTNGWLKTTYGGKTGYVAKDYVSLDLNYLDGAYTDKNNTSTNNYKNNQMASLVNVLKSQENTGAGLLGGTASSIWNYDVAVVGEENKWKPGKDKAFNILGSGDVDGQNDFVYGTLAGFDVPPIDENKFNNYSNNSGYYEEYSQQPVIVNNYNIQTSEADKMNRLNAVLRNTYNVRSDKMEKSLEIIAEKLDIIIDNKPKNTNNRESNETPDLFSNNEIPSQLVRLYTGE